MSIDAQDADGRSALSCACADGALDVVKVLVSEGALIEQCDMDNFKPIHHAALNEHDEIVKYLLVQTAMKKLSEEAVKGPESRKKLREYKSQQMQEDLEFDIKAPEYGLNERTR